MQTEKKFPKIINCYCPKGGVGKSTIAVTLTVACRMNDLKVAFYDLDPQKTATVYFSRIKDKFRPNVIFDRAGYETPDDIDIVIYDFPPNLDYVPKKGTIIVAPTGSSTFDLMSYKKVLEYEKTNTVIKVLNKVSMSKKADKELMKHFKHCVVISQNSAIENALGEFKTIFNFSHPNSRKAQYQFQFLIDCIFSGKTVEMTQERLNLISETGARLNDFQE